MATWAIYGWTGGNDTAAAASSALALDSSSALSFGGGIRSAFQTNITLNSWNSAMHFAQDTASSSVDMCENSHLYPIAPHAADFTGLDTGCVINAIYQAMAVGTPHAARGVGWQFTHGFVVQCSPVTIWAGTGADVSSDPQSAYFAMADLTSANPTWATVKPGSKLTLKPHGTAASEHWWNVAIALQPLAVGHNGENKIKIETTYF